MAVARWAAMAVLLLGAAPACAQEAETPPEAVEFYRQAREHYESGEYRQAADDLERALMLDPDSPTLVYNLARVYELLGEPERALQRYEQYQRLLPQQQAQEQDRAEATIRRLQGAAANQEPSEALEQPREVAPLRQLPGLVLVRENGVADAAFWGVLAGGGVALVAGAVLWGVALDLRGQVDNWVHGRDGDDQDQEDTHAVATQLALGGDIAFGVGAVGVIAAGLLYFVRDHTVERAPVGAGDSEEASIEPTIGASAQALTVGVAGRW